MKQLSLFQRFSLLCLLALPAFGLVFGLLVTNSLERNMLLRSRQLTAEFINHQVTREFPPHVLAAPPSPENYRQLSDQIATLSLGTNIKRIKVWNQEMRVVWSDNLQIVGKQFVDNAELAEALAGEVVAELSNLHKAEQEHDRDHARLLELYVPILYPGATRVQTVFEVYQDIHQLQHDIARQKRAIWLATGCGILALYLLLAGIVLRASRAITRQNRELTASEERFRTLVRDAHDAIIAMSHTGTILLMNAAAEEMFGCHKQRCTGQEFPSFISPETRQEFVTALQAFCRGDVEQLSNEKLELTGLRRDGSSFPLELGLSRSGIGTGVMVTAIIRDIAQRRAMQQHLLAAERQQTATTIAASIGHELNNAITGIIGFAEIMKQHPANAEMAKRCAEVFLDKGARLQLYARNLLSIGTPRQPELQFLNLRQVIEDEIRLLSDSGLLKQFTVTKDLTEVPPIAADRNQIEQVLRNLLINAIHAMQTGGLLTIATRPGRPGFAEFSVTDTGCGIPPEIRERIFTPFFTTKGEQEGTGLGMFITKEIIDQHHGYLTLDSSVGVGTTITIGLPTNQQSPTA